VSGPTAQGAKRSLTLRPADFRLLVAGQISTVFGSTLLRFVLALYVLDLTGRADLFAVLLAISAVPVLLSPIGGAVSDRFNRQRLMVLYDAVCCAVTLGFLPIMLTGHASVGAVGVVMVVLGTVSAMETPNGTACIPQLVAKEKLEQANGVIQAVQSLSGIAAPVLGGLLYGAVGLRALVLVSGAAFGLAAIEELFIRIPFARRDRIEGMAGTIAKDLRDGFAYVWRDRFTRKLMVIAALLNFALMPCFGVAAPFVLRITLGSGDTLYGASMGIIEAAMILGALRVSVFTKRMRVDTLWRWILGIAFLFVPLALAVTPKVLGLGFAPPFALFMISLSLMAAATTILSIFVIVRVQASTPGENLGKVMAILGAVAQCAAPVGQLVYGFMFQRSSGAAHIPLLLAGAITTGIALIGRSSLSKENASNGIDNSNT
jgi:MFS family permease